MLVKILGVIDFLAAIAFLGMVFGIDVFVPFLLFTGGLLLVKSLFIFGGDVLSFLDLASAISLLLSIFFGLPVFWLWILSFLLLGKSIVSFV